MLAGLALATAAAQPCRPDQVEVTTRCCDGAAGSVFAQVRIRNTSKAACLLEGVRKPTSSDEAGRPLPVSFRGNDDIDKHGKGLKRLELPPAGTAAITLMTESPLYEYNRCGKRLRIEIGELTAEWEMLACGPPGKPVKVFASGLYPAPEGK